MKLYEFQAKQIFARYGIKIPRGEVAEKIEDVAKIAEKLGGKAVLKAQVLVGGRGKAGGIRKVESVAQAIEVAKEMFGKSIKGEKITKVYVEE
ncbi:MAG: ATP-grasp domain-containing protein, partial [Archaeoglobaceae archaeon]